MRFIITLSVLFVAGCSTITPEVNHRAQVTATGYGSSYDEAIQSAKILAIEEIASTFVTGKRQLVNGKFDETLGQYHGGAVTHLVVKSAKVINGLHIVVIRADVSTNKVNSFVESAESPTVASVLIDQYVTDRTEVEQAWRKISETTFPFVAADSQVKPTYQVEGSNVSITYTFNLTWNDKWIDDAIKLVKTVNQPIARTTKTAVCLRDYYGAKWCMGISALPESIPKFVTYKATIHHNNGSPDTITMVPYITTEQLWWRRQWQRLTSAGWFESDTYADTVTFRERTFDAVEFHHTVSVAEQRTISDITFEIVN